ncbi:MAG TPA: hypothetical protein K8V88_12200 [Companilactobacillus farciminis]|uniref:Uncharacterized protein n=1 Tax=Companilactobacillus farciminis TaxID=1612 RepID=A0A921HUJ5_9LACO|nr:hypothetical protein [Companilactobacillus farciminis]
MNLKIGGSNVGKIMYNGQEFGGATKLEPGTVIYKSNGDSNTVKNVHLLSTTKDWNNLNGINIQIYDGVFRVKYGNIDISSDILKSLLDTEKEYQVSDRVMTISRSIVDGEYRLNISASDDLMKGFVIKAI